MATRARVPAHLGFTPELIENARRRYEETSEPTVTIAADLGIHRHSLRRLARNHNWIRRNTPSPRDLSPALRLLEQARAVAAPPPAAVPDAAAAEASVAAEASAASAPGDLATIERLERAVLAELATVEAMRASLGPLPQRWTDAERTARTLSLLTQTLQHLQRLRAGGAQAYDRNDNYDDDMPEDIDAFRYELARRIDAFVASRTGAGGAGGDGGAEPAEETP